MPSTYTSNNGLEKPGIGEQDGTWGSSLNNDIDLLDQSLDGVSQITLTGTTYTLTITDGAPSNGRCRVIVFTGTPSGPVSVSITPVNISKVYWIVNQSTQTVNITNGSGTFVAVATVTTAPIFCDGAGNATGLQAGNNVFADLQVNGTATFLGPLFIGVQTIAQYVGTATGNVNLSLESVSGGQYIIATFGTETGLRTRLAFGSGSNAAPGFIIPVPTGFSSSNIICGASLNQSIATAGNNIGRIFCQTSGATIVASTSDQTGGINYTTTANWWAFSWKNNY